MDGEIGKARSSAQEYADKLRKRAERTERAGEDERRTAAHLDEHLRPLGFHCLHDCRWPGSAANIDHVVVGPTGVFVVDDKHSVIDVEVRADGSLRKGRWNFDSEFRKLRDQTAAVTAAIGQRADGVLAIHGCAVQGDGHVIDDVALVRADALADLLTEQEAAIPHGMLPTIAARAVAALRPRKYDPPDPQARFEVRPATLSTAADHESPTALPDQAQAARSGLSLLGDVMEAFGRLIVAILGWLASLFERRRAAPQPQRRRKTQRRPSRKQSQTSGGIGSLVLALLIIFVGAPVYLNSLRDKDEPTPTATTVQAQVLTGGPVQVTDAYECPSRGAGFRHVISWVGGDPPFTLLTAPGAEGPWEPVPATDRQAVREGVPAGERRLFRLQYATPSGGSEASLLSTAPGASC